MPVPSQIPIQIATFSKGFHDWSYQFDPSEGRELSNYDFGGHFEECSWRVHREQRECLKNFRAARKLIHDHWMARQRAYITIDCLCADCMPTLHVFVEPDGSGRWRVAAVMEEPRYPPRYWRDAFDLKYRRATEDDGWEVQGERVLSLLSSTGTEVGYF